MATIPFVGGSATIDEHGLSAESSDGKLSAHVGPDGASVSAGGSSVQVGGDGVEVSTPIGTITVGPDGVQVQGNGSVGLNLPKGALCLDLSGSLASSAVVTGDSAKPVAMQAELLGQRERPVCADVGAKVDGTLAGKLDASARVDASAKVNADANLQLGLTAPVGVVLSGDPRHPVTAQVSANLGGTGTPLELKLSPQLPRGTVRLAMPRLELAFELFGRRIFGFSLEVDAHVHMEPGPTA